MPLKKYLSEPGITPEAARAMMDAFAIASARLNELGLKTSTTALAQRLSTLVNEGQTDAARLAEALLDSFLSKENNEPNALTHVSKARD